MAKKGTLGAFKQVTPRVVDEGAIAEKIAGTFAAQQTQKRKEKASKLLLKQKQDQLNAKQAQKTFKEMSDLSKIAKDFTTLKPIKGARSVSSLLVDQGKKEYASLIKEYQGAGYGRRIEIQDKLRQMSEWGKQWNSASEGLNVKLAEISAGMGSKYDPVLSAKWATGLSRALQSGSEIGAVKRGDNSIDIGKYITVEDVGTGALSVTFRDDQGNEFISGSLADITGKLSGEGLTAFVDSDKEFSQNFGKGQLADILQTADPYNGLIETSRGTNERSTKKRLRQQFDETYLATDQNGIYTNNSMRKEVALGRTPEQVKERAVTAAWNRMRQESTEMLKSNSGFASRKKQADIQTASDAVASVLRGDNQAIGNLEANTPWRDPFATISSPTLQGVSRDGNIVTVTIANTKGDSEEIEYDISNEADFSKITNLVHSGISKDTGVLDANVNEVRNRVSQMNLDPAEGSEFARKPEQSFELAKTQLEEAGNEEEILKAARPAINAIRSYGYTVDESLGNLFSKHKLVLKDKQGKEVDRASGYSDSSFSKEIVKLMDRLQEGKADADVTLDVNGKSVSLEQAVSDYKKLDQYKNVPDDQLREAIKKQFKVK